MDKLYHGKQNVPEEDKAPANLCSPAREQLQLQLRNVHGQYACSYACHHVKHKSGFCKVQLKLPNSKLQITDSSLCQIRLAARLSTLVQLYNNMLQVA